MKNLLLTLPKKIFYKFTLLLFILFMLIGNLHSKDIDITKKPEPLSEKAFKFPEYKTFEFDNGLKVFVIEDHEQPTVSMRMMIAGGNSVDTTKPGTAELFASLLTKGAGKMTALQIAEKLDGLGADISASSTTDYFTIEATGLMKHFDIIMEMFAKIILEPTFPEAELKKLAPQMIAGIQQEKGDPRILASKLGKKVIYGENHPYALYPTEESINSITIKDIKNYYSTFVLPNNATIAIIGDFNTSDLAIKFNKYFGEWEKKKISPINLPTPKQMPMGVYFIERPGAVQSTISLNFKTIQYASKDFDKLSLATSVISGGFAGRLFQTLREKYSYTYTPFGKQTQNKYFGMYSCGADVKNIVTDSAIDVTLNQIRNLSEELPLSQEVNRVQKYQAGSFNMSLENSSFIANAIQNAYFFGIPVEFMESYAKRILGLSSYDVQDAANMYLKTNKAFIVVVGNSEVKEKLTKYGKIFDYNIDLEPLSGEKAKIEKISMTSQELIQKYIKAIGGTDKINSIITVLDSAQTTLISNGTESIGMMVQYQKAPNKKYSMMDFSTYKQHFWVDGQNVWVKLTDIQRIEAPKSEVYLYDATLFKDTKLLDMGYKCNVLGRQQGNILMKSISPAGYEATYYFDEKNYLLNKIERIQDMPTGPIPITETIKNYITIDGLKLPGVIETSSPLYTYKIDNRYILNIEIDDSIFLPK